MNHSRVAMIVVVVALAALFLVPFVPARIAISPDASLTTLHYPSGGGAGWGVESDPSGTYILYTLSSMPCTETTCWTTDVMNLTTYKQLERDPYTGGVWDSATCASFVQGSVILFACPQARCSPNFLNGSISCDPVSKSTPTVGNGTESVAYLLFHQGAVYYYSKYLWG